MLCPGTKTDAVPRNEPKPLDAKLHRDFPKMNTEPKITAKWDAVPRMTDNRGHAQDNRKE